MDRPGGGPFRLDVMGVLVGRPNAFSGVSLVGGPPPGPVLPFCLFSINLLCCSRMFIARSICSRMVGSCVLKPGERHATPMSWIASPALCIWSLEVNGPAEGRAAEGCPLDMLELARLRRLGRWRPVGRSGEVGSFLTMTLGMCAGLQGRGASVSKRPSFSSKIHTPSGWTRMLCYVVWGGVR
jgi:hypothetical protein